MLYWKKWFKQKKMECDKKTPIGLFSIEHLYYRSDRVRNFLTKLKCVEIKKNMGWCDDPLDQKNYNKLISIEKKIKCEKLHRKDHKYDLFIPIKYNYPKPIKFRGSCIFIHLTNNFKPTAGCIAMQKKDFLIMLKLINKKTKIQIN
tara:strand:- start:50 stop:487 length:438 start_codon:yes stop_codon:yes gene_type:complete